MYRSSLPTIFETDNKYNVPRPRDLKVCSGDKTDAPFEIEARDTKYAPQSTSR